MKIITVGDIHGRPHWKAIDVEKYDKVIFTGDFVDGYGYTDEQIFTNLKEIYQLKVDNPLKVVLILGNHDLQYMWDYKTFGCSGFRSSMYEDLHHLFFTNRNQFKVAHQEKDHIWTHAGISRGWYKFNKKLINQYFEKFKKTEQESIDGLEREPDLNLGDILNIIYGSKDNDILHQVGDLRGGVYQYGGITWADRRETIDYYIDGYHQIVGHTPIDQITKFGDEKGSIRYIDVLGKYDKDRPQSDFFFEMEI